MQFSIPLYDALLGVSIAPDKAKAVVEAFQKERDDMISTLATKDDMRVLRDSLRSDLSLLESRMTVKLGTMLAAAIGIGVALMKAL